MAQDGIQGPLSGLLALTGTACSDVARNELDPQALNLEIELLDRQLDNRAPLLSEAEVARLLGRDIKTQQNKRHANPAAGPDYVQFPGQRGVMYPRHEVLRYMATHILLSRGRRIHKA